MARRVIINDTEYETLIDAASALGITPPTLRWRLKSENYPDHKYVDGLPKEPKKKKIVTPTVSHSYELWNKRADGWVRLRGKSNG